jgi:hypothetical protein
MVGLVWGCTSILPPHAGTMLEMPGIKMRSSHSYAEAARRLKPCPNA